MLKYMWSLWYLWYNYNSVCLQPMGYFLLQIYHFFGTSYLYLYFSCGNETHLKYILCTMWFPLSHPLLTSLIIISWLLGHNMKFLINKEYNAWVETKSKNVDLCTFYHICIIFISSYYYPQILHIWNIDLSARLKNIK